MLKKIFIKILESFIPYYLGVLFLLLLWKSDRFSNEACLIVSVIKMNLERKMMRQLLLWITHLDKNGVSMLELDRQVLSYFIFLVWDNLNIHKHFATVLCILNNTSFKSKFGILQWDGIIKKIFAFIQFWKSNTIKYIQLNH